MAEPNNTRCRECRGLLVEQRCVRCDAERERRLWFRLHSLEEQDGPDEGDPTPEEISDACRARRERAPRPRVGETQAAPFELPVIPFEYYGDEALD